MIAQSTEQARGTQTPNPHQDAGVRYGWSPYVPHSCSFVGPPVIDCLRGLNVRRVLDLGCGSGGLCGALGAAGWDVVGVEPDAEGIALARTTYPALRFHQLGVNDNPRALLEREAPFDAVVSTEVIEHLFAPRLLPAFASQVLVPGGHLVVSAPYHGYLKNLLIALTGKWDRHHTALWEGGHIKFWSPATLSQLLYEHGFKVTAFRGAGRTYWLWKSMILVARKLPAAESVR